MSTDRKKISELDAVTSVATDDLLLISQKVGDGYISKAVPANGIIGDMPATSGDWNSVYEDVRTMSGSWEESADITALRNDVGASSGNWNSAYTTVRDNSASWDETPDITNLVSASGDWNDARTTVGANSAIWALSGSDADLGEIPATSGNWNSVFTTVGSFSANWDDVRTTLGSSSGNWNVDDTTWTGLNWISTTKGISAKKIESALKDVGISYTERTSEFTSDDNGKILEAYYNTSGSYAFNNDILDAYSAYLTLGYKFSQDGLVTDAIGGKSWTNNGMSENADGADGYCAGNSGAYMATGYLTECDFSGSTDFTVAMRLYSTGISDGEGGIWGSRHDGEATGTQCYLSQKAGGALWWGYRIGSTSYYADTGLVISNNIWTLLIVKRVGDTFYIIKDAETPVEIAIAGTGLLNSASNGIVIGRMYVNWNNYSQNGRFDEMYVWKGVGLSVSAITELQTNFLESLADKYIRKASIKTADIALKNELSSSGNWNSVFTTVGSTSASWNDVITTVGANSGVWALSGGEASLGDIPATSAEWNSVYDTVGSASATWNQALDLANNQTDSYTLQLTDAGRTIWMNTSGANTLTIPANSGVAFPVDTIVAVVQEGAGATTVTAENGVTLNGTENPSVGGAITAQYTGVTLTKRDTNTWIAVGNIGAVT